MNKFFFNKNLVKKIKNFFFPFYKTKEARIIFNIFNEGQLKNKNIAMFVGGCVRKYLKNEKIDDIDIATVLTPEEIKQKFSKTNVKVIETGLDHGTLTLIINDKKFEVTTLRKDTENFGRHATVSFLEDWKMDSERRDFTINSIYLDQKGKIFDPQLGIQDLKNNFVKFIGNPNQRIQEDYLRIIRFLRFSIQYDSNADIETIQALKLNLNGIKFLSKERILSELVKILSLKNFSNILKHKNKKEIFLMIFPEFINLNFLSKIKFLSKFEKNEIDTNILLATMLIDKTNNHEYFCHKYKTSNYIKDQLSFFATTLEEYDLDKQFFKKNLKKNIYFLGKNRLKKFNLFLFLKNSKLSLKKYNEITTSISKTLVPEFPYNGKYLIKKGLVEGKKVGLAIKELERAWLKNNFFLNSKSIVTIVNKVKNQTY
ncbi:MAG: CCA tRNA nucleotidyltransferase [Pelagibacteraceae bacterium]